MILTLFFVIVCEQNFIQGLPSAQFFNDANTSVGQQIGVKSAFINQPGSKIGSGISQQQGRVTQKASAIFHNDGRTQVGQQIGPANAFNNRPGAQVGNKPKQNPSSQSVRTNCKTLIKGSTARQTCCDRKKNSEVRRKCNNAATQIQSDGGQTNRKEQQSAIFNNDGNTQVGKQIGPDSAFNNQPGAQIGNKPKQNSSQPRMNCKILIKGSTARQTCCNRKKNPQVRNKCNNAPTQNQNSGNRQLVQQSATFNNDRNTQVGQQIGPKSAFNNQPGASVGSPRRTG